MKKKLICFVLSAVLFSQVLALPALASGGAGLYRSFTFGTYKVDVINMHSGYAGPTVGTRWHTNVVLRSLTVSGYVERRNYHVSAYKSGSNYCWTIWESKTNKTYSNCHSTQSGAQTGVQNKLKQLINEYTNNSHATTVAVIGATIILIYHAIDGVRVSLRWA
ncbi:hypothetical protein [Cytobacillus firmus]|uniref:Uncharacterized protein n=1 Tax=Cytobacillus firmus TaxID=1399 RepID=A0AA46SHG1_CYTFI|nr:hypothetical protein [Cytobacillus firmus]UYG98196.1 hypothetical protein OD459_25335 [Cytobacillus firmus]